MPPSSSGGSLPRLFEVEDDGGARERQLVAVLDGSQEEARFLCRRVRHHAVALRAVEIELEQRDQLAALHEPIGAVDRRTGGVEVVRKHLLALCDLLGDARFELVESADVAPWL